LFIALFAEVISQWDANNIYSYGYGRVQVLSGFANGIFLVFISFYVLVESIERFFEPPEVKTDRLLLVSFLGFVVNMVGVFAFHDHHGHDHGADDGHSHGHSHAVKKDKKKNKSEHEISHGHGDDHQHGHDDHGHKHGGAHANKEKQGKKFKTKQQPHDHEHSENMQGVFLHLLADTLGSVGVIISSFIIQMWGWTLADPICSFCIAVLIFLSTIPLLKGAARTLLQCTPGAFEPILDDCLARIMKIEGVLSYRDPHFWNHSGNNIVGSIHIQVDEKTNEQKVLQIVTSMLKEKGVVHLVVEIEKPHTGKGTPVLTGNISHIQNI